MNTPNCSYEFYTIHTDSISSDSWENGSQSKFTSHLFRPLKDVVQVSVLNANIDVSGSNVAYLSVEQLISPFNETTGVVSSSGNSIIISNPTTKDRTRTAIARLNVSSSGRTLYNQQDFSTQTQYVSPIRKLDRITCELLDENGNTFSVNSNTFITYRITCLRDNMPPKKR
jgi:hypothetical protein